MAIKYRKQARDWNRREVLMPAVNVTVSVDMAETPRPKREALLLDEWRVMWDSLDGFRRRRRRAKEYNFGNQWNDMIKDPKHGGMITERDYIIRQGKVPLKNNVIRKLTKSVLGVYRSDRREPVAIARDKDEAKLGDMMSIALQYAYQTNEVYELNARGLEEAMLSGMAVASVRFKWNRDRHIFDVYVANENPHRIFFNTDVCDVRFDDLRTVGFLRDYHIEDLISDFAKNDEDERRIRAMYANVDVTYGADDAMSGRRVNDLSFYMAEGKDMVRVIEGWTLESKPRLRCHDTLNAEMFVAELDDNARIDAENVRRRQSMLEAGGNPEDAALIEYEWFVDRFWMVRFLTPLGDVIFERETPYLHNSSPYVVRAYPMIDGEIHSFVEDVIDQQRYINRYITMMDFIRGASAKGLLVFPEELIPDDMTKENILEEWTRYNGVIFAKTRPGVSMPQQLSTNAVQMGDVEMLNLQLRLLEEISGVHGAMQGKSASSGTPSSLYMQEAQNASNNLLDMLEWYEGFIKARDYKMMKTIQQFYKEPRYICIAGKQFSEESKWYDPSKIANSDFDTIISESGRTAAYRMVSDSNLRELLQAGLITLKDYLEQTPMPFGDALLERINQREQELAEAQQQPMQAGGGSDAAAAQLHQDLADMVNETSGKSDSRAVDLMNRAFGIRGDETTA